MNMQPERNLVQSFEELRNDLKSFIETRYEILRAELSSALKRAQGAAILFAAGAVFGAVGLILLGICASFAIGLAFGSFTNQAGVVWGFLITGAGSVIIAGFLGLAGRASLKTANLVPERTLRVLQRDQEALKQQQQGGQYVEPERIRRRA